MSTLSSVFLLHLRRFAFSLTTVLCTFSLTGCGIGLSAPATSEPIVTPSFSGKTFGGPNPIIGATVKLYTTGNSDGTNGGYGVATMRQEANAFTNAPNYPNGDTDTGGSFNFAGGYNCPAGQFAYIVASGGNTGASSTATGATATGSLSGSGEGPITVTAGGTGYLSATVAIAPSDGVGSGATATATVTNGVVTSITVTNAGTGYDATPTVTVSNPSYYNSTNNNAVLVAALGRCEDLYATLTAGNYTGYKGSNIFINELTTVAAGYALGHFSAVSGSQAAGTLAIQIGAPATNNVAPVGTAAAMGTSTAAAGLAHAFVNASNLVNVFINTGFTGQTGANSTLPGNASAVVPQQLINSIGNILVSCVNSVGGTSGDGSACGKLFGYTTLPSAISSIFTYTPAVPTNTFSAVVNLAANPTLTASTANVASLFNLANPFTSVYSPALGGSSGLNDYSIAINYPASLGVKYPYSGALDLNDVYYIANAASSGTAPVNVLSFSSAGTLLGTSGGNANMKYSPGLSMDALGNGYFGDGSGSGTTALGVFTTSAGVASTPVNYSIISSTLGTQGSSGLLKVYATAVDLQNNLWVWGASNSTTAPATTTYMYECPPSFTATSTCTYQYGSAGAATSSGAILSIDPNQNIWSGSTTSLAVEENFGTATAPVYGTGLTAGNAVPSADTATTAPNPALGLVFTGTATNPKVFLSGYKTGTTGVQPFTYTQGGTGGVGVTSITAGTTLFTGTAGATVPSGAYSEGADGLGSVWVADFNGHAIFQTTPGATTPQSYRLIPCLGGSTTCSTIFTTSAGASKPLGVSVDSAGSLWSIAVYASTGYTGQVVQIIGSGAPAWPLLSLGKLGQP